MAVIGATSFIMWMVVGVFQANTSFRRSVIAETEVVKSASRLSRRFRADVHAALAIEFHKGGVLQEFKAPASFKPSPRIPPAGDDNYGRIVPLPANLSPPGSIGGSTTINEAPKDDAPENDAPETEFDSPPEPDAGSNSEDTEATATGRPLKSDERESTQLKLTLADGVAIQYETTPGGLQRTVYNAAGKKVNRNTTRLAPAAIATLQLEAVNGRPLAILLIDFLVAKSYRHRNAFVASRRMRIEAVAPHAEAR